MICVPSQEDLSTLTHKPLEWQLKDNSINSTIDNKTLNFEYSLMFGKTVNLSKKDL